MSSRDSLKLTESPFPPPVLGLKVLASPYINVDKGYKQPNGYVDYNDHGSNAVDFPVTMVKS
jgi:hypothetical protein